MVSRFKKWGYQLARFFGLYDPPKIAVLIHGGGWLQGAPSDFRPLPTLLGNDGWQVENLDYPLWPEASVAAQERWIAATVEEIAEENPLSSIVAVGGSAGAQLALRNSTLFTRIAALNPALNTCEIGQPFVEAMAGECEKHRPAQPACLVKIWHGTADDTVPIRFAREYATPRNVELREVEGVGHGWFNADNGETYREVVQWLKATG